MIKFRPGKRQPVLLQGPQHNFKVGLHPGTDPFQRKAVLLNGNKRELRVVDERGVADL